MRSALEHALKTIETHGVADESPFIHGDAVLDLAPFSIEDFPETPRGYEAMRERILELGFTLSAEEHAAWDARIERMREFA